MNRKKRLKIIQISLLFLGLVIIFFTYFTQEKKNRSSENFKSTVKKQMINLDANRDTFINVKYSGLDLNGNRYIIKSEKAYNNDEDSPNIVNMENVISFFYFKDETVLEIISDKAIYNNKSLDMEFDGNIKATYMDSKLFAQKAIYNNKESSLTVTENVKVLDSRGTMNADKLFFDIKKQKLNISSLNKKKINANINLK